MERGIKGESKWERETEKEMEIESEEIPHEENLLAKREATKARRELQAAKSLSRAAKALLCIQNGRKPPLGRFARRRFARRGRAVRRRK